VRDPFLREVIGHALTSLTEESGFFTTRTEATAGGVSGAGDMLSCAIFDGRGRLIGQSRGVEMHQAAVDRLMQAVLAVLPPDRWSHGDVVMTNDPFIGGIHPTDVAVFAPIFAGPRPAFFYGGMRWVSDLGGVSSGGLPANATEVFHEGIIFPPVRLLREGELNGDVAGILRANSRVADRVMSELLALAGGVSLAAARLLELVEKYGLERLLEVIEEVLDYSERLTRQGIERIPDGTYRGEYTVEDDGIERDRTHHVEVRVTIDGGDCSMDFGGTGPAARGAINSTYSQSLSQCMSALRHFIDAEIPWNEGAYRALKVNLPPGTLVNAQYPSATNIRLATGLAITDAVYQALAAACPEKVRAPSSAPYIMALAGFDPFRDRPFSFLILNGGATGARATGDGQCGTAMITPRGGPELTERNFPITTESVSIFTDSGGPGRWRGGAGIVKRFVLHCDADLTARANDRYHLPPPGLAGGRPGRAGSFVLNEGRPDERLLRGKETNVRVKAGDTLTTVLCGGGGHGDPFTRPVELVAADVRDGWVSVEGAARDYGVVIVRPSGAPDLVATARMRAAVVAAPDEDHRRGPR
jgi:N-methylhydantoinase B